MSEVLAEKRHSFFTTLGLLGGVATLNLATLIVLGGAGYAADRMRDRNQRT